jgi:hypothetical protein
MHPRTLAPLALLLAAGCGVDNFASVQFLEICFPPAPTSGACIYPATCANTLLGRPRVDVGLAYNFETTIQLNNQLTSNADSSTGRVNTHDAHIEKYTITYDVPGAALPGSVSLANDTVRAAGSTTVLVEVLPNVTVTQLAAIAPATLTTIVAKVVASGRYDSGDTFETGPYKVALDICSGCPELGFPVANFCTGTQTIGGFCPGNAVVAGVVVSLPINVACQ